jgi:hypothetical protein
MDRHYPRSTRGLRQILVDEGLWSEDSSQVVRADFGFQMGNSLNVERIQ